MQERFYESGSCVQKNCASLGVHPTLEAPLETIARGTAAARDVALLRLYDLNPGAARPIAIERIRRMDVTHETSDPNHSLLLLADKAIPELDDVLVDALGHQPWPGQFFVARYASEAVAERLRAIATTWPGFPCGPLIQYFFRVDPAWASQQLAAARQARRGASCPLYVPIAEDVPISLGLEQAAIDDLKSSDDSVQRNAQKLLKNAGSASAEQPLWDAMPRLASVTQDIWRNMLEDSLVDALSKAQGWVLTTEKIDRLMAACLSESCRRKVGFVRGQLQSPVGITPIPREINYYAGVGPFLSRTREQLAAKIAQFPKGTQFVFTPGDEGTWLREQRTRLIRGILDDAGMTLTNPTAR